MTPSRPVPSGVADPLAPVREALLRAARAEADRVTAEARAERDRRLTAARDRAAVIQAEARKRGHDDAAAAGAADEAAAGRSSRQTVLRARRDAYRALEQQIRERASAWLAEPAVEAAVRARVAAALRPGASVIVTSGAVTGTLDDRQVEVTARGLTGEALRDLGTRIEEMWRT
ncbi:hypothetical protein [Paractinoplanes brasiliensis]|uniref:Uncharacterized protein n=1 Tax=Paractinoplanes brasiliensis TaxID=52695 RepID=A0A4V3C794_9ACTN|nr:hypothetical protein [Actinoplanes brasiliensis]TDO36738.1 hypothetical protein C8E87_0320 [Actinoplanes brasiliensis]GID32376.1 hypothetical protein Abr02nite_73590 [Actinoplanes brasiliensis]